MPLLNKKQRRDTDRHHQDQEADPAEPTRIPHGTPPAGGYRRNASPGFVRSRGHYRILAMVTAAGWPGHAGKDETTACHGDAMPQSAAAISGPLLADAEIPEDHVEHVLDIDPPGEPAQRRRGDPQFFRQ